jgi:hemoglobin
MPPTASALERRRRAPVRLSRSRASWTASSPRAEHPVRDGLDRLRHITHGPRAADVTVDSEAVTRPTIFEVAGGEPAFQALAAAHHRLCLADPVLEHPFSHGTRPDHVERLGACWAEVFGGPPRFTEEYGGHSAMLTIHAAQGAEEDLGRRFVACFVGATGDARLPGDPELRAALRAYMEWAVAEVLSYSPRGSHVPWGLPAPRWGWDGLE